ncbi:MAG TPA: hypothetical protein VLF20_05500, partial [Patescibacteria group bacterium]|nr:hypothetical protein [Patescibacteria group bacterium]
QQDTRSRAATVSRPPVPGHIPGECNQQSGGGGCCYQPPGGGDRPGAMCKADGGGSAWSSTPSQTTLDSRCPGGFYPNHTTTRPTSASQWFCPGGNEYRCCRNAAPDQVAASANPSTITLPTSSVSLTGSARDRDSESWRNTLDYTWVKVSGPTSPSLPSNDSSPTHTITGLQQGTYKFKLRVSDGFATVDSGEVTVTVDGVANKQPTANAGEDKPVTLPTSSVTLTGSGSDPDGDTITYAWTKVSGPNASIVSPTAATTNVTGLVEGTYVFKLVVSDGKGGTAEDTVTVTVGISPTTTLNLDLLLHGIGKAGDNVNPGEDGGGTKPPVLKHLQRLVVVKLVQVGDEEDKEYVIPDVLVTYDTTKGSFIGQATFVGTDEEFADFESGPHAIIVKFPQSLSGIVPPGYRTITKGIVNNIPQFSLETGDINIEGENYDKRNIADYNLLLECYEDFEPASPDCTATEKAQADIDDDGKVNYTDLTLFLRELSTQGGIGN